MCHLCAHFCSDQVKVTPTTQDMRFFHERLPRFLCWVTALLPPLPESDQSDMNSILDSHIEVLKRMCISKGFIFFWEVDKQTHWLVTANTLYLLGCSSHTRYWQNDKAGWDHFLKLYLSWGIKRRARERRKFSFLEVYLTTKNEISWAMQRFAWRQLQGDCSSLQKTWDKRVAFLKMTNYSLLSEKYHRARNNRGKGFVRLHPLSSASR